MGALDYRWRLRELMAQRGIFTAKELAPHLAAHGVRLSDSQVWRLVTGRPERLNLGVLVVLCEILDCTPSDLIERVEVAAPKKRAASGRPAGKEIVPKRARVRGREDG
jgi:DNA-binding Xre family transcriptional regulator